MIKAITFPQFLDCVFAISELKEPGLFRASPKAALEKVISENFLPAWLAGTNEGSIEDVCVDELTTLRELDSAFYEAKPMPFPKLEL